MDRHGDAARYLGPEEKSNYLTLKEAAQLTDYTADYIGQLIRQGKIEGFQVYTNVSWVTTEKAVREYVEGKGKSEGRERDLVWYHDPHTYLRATLYLVIGCLGMLLVGVIALFALAIDRHLSESALESYETQLHDRQ